MADALTRELLARHLVAAARDDPRIVGIVDYGSGGEGRADEWSDLDVAVFLRDEDFEPFERAWKEWAARYELTAIMTGLLCALLRLESGAVERWRAAEAAAGIERAVSPRRLAGLDACIPGTGMDGIRHALLNAVKLGRDVCADIAATRGWPWPKGLAARLLAALDIDRGQPPG